MPDEIVALVVRDAQGTAKDIAELLTEIGPDVWAARIHDPLIKARLEEIRNRLPTTGAASEATLGSRATEATLVAVLAAVDQLEAHVDSLEALTQGVRDRLPLALTAAGNLKTALVDASGATLQNGAETAVAAAAIQVIAANPSRKVLVLQNVGPAIVRVGASGVTATTGLRIASGGERIFTMPFCPTNAIYAIREGALDSTVFAAEVV